MIGSILAKLEKEILQLGGYRTTMARTDRLTLQADWLDHFPRSRFPIGVVHELICQSPEQKAASLGCIAGFVRQFLACEQPIIWVSMQDDFCPSMLSLFGLSPQQILVVQPPDERSLLWCVEEALRLGAASAVVAALPRLNFKQSRRFQLAVEKSGTTGFLLHEHRGPTQTTACVTRWNIRAIPSEPMGSLPGVGKPAWHVTLEKSRNGKSGAWEFCWTGKRFAAMHASSSEQMYHPAKAV